MTKSKNNRLIRIVDKKLGQYKVLGFAYKYKNLIELEEREIGKNRFSNLIHELIHMSAPYIDEPEVLRVEKILVDNLWAQGYRRVDNSEK